MNLLKVTTNLDEAVKKRLIAIRDIAGRGTWKGMDITLENLTRFRGVDVRVPSGTVFREGSGQFQQMMMAESIVIHVPAGQRIVRPLDEAICTQPRVPAPPPRTVKIASDVRAVCTMSDKQFKDLIRQGYLSAAEAQIFRKWRQIAQDPTLMAGIRRGQLEWQYNYTAISPVSVSPTELAEAFLGMGINLYKYGNKSRAVEIFRRAASNAAPDAQQFYAEIAMFADGAIGKAEADLVLEMLSGSSSERRRGKLIIDEALESPSDDIITATTHASVTDAVLSALAGAREYPDDRFKAQGRAVERATVTCMEWLGDTHVTDRNVAESTTSAGYDVTSDQRVASCKCHLQGSLEDKIQAYIEDLETAIGLGHRLYSFTRAVRELHHVANSRKQGYPAELAESFEMAEEYVQKYAELWIPGDHALAVREELRQRLYDADQIAREIAARRLGLNPQSPTYENDVTVMLDRVQGVWVGAETIMRGLPTQ